MTLMTWNPVREMDTLHREIDRIFDDMGMGRWTYPFSRFSFLPGRAARMYPLLNMSEDADNLYIEALAPGIDPQSLKVTVVQKQLMISGEKGHTDANIKAEAWHRNERAGGAFTRTIELPVAVEEGRTQAEYKNGLLTITLPKAEVAKPKQIAIQVA